MDKDKGYTLQRVGVQDEDGSALVLILTVDTDVFSLGWSDFDEVVNSATTEIDNLLNAKRTELAQP